MKAVSSLCCWLLLLATTVFSAPADDASQEEMSQFASDSPDEALPEESLVQSWLDWEYALATAVSFKKYDFIREVLEDQSPPLISGELAAHAAGMLDDWRATKLLLECQGLRQTQIVSKAFLASALTPTKDVFQELLAKHFVLVQRTDLDSAFIRAVDANDHLVVEKILPIILPSNEGLDVLLETLVRARNYNLLQAILRLSPLSTFSGIPALKVASAANDVDSLKILLHYMRINDDPIPGVQGAFITALPSYSDKVLQYLTEHQIIDPATYHYGLDVAIVHHYNWAVPIILERNKWDLPIYEKFLATAVREKNHDSLSKILKYLAHNSVETSGEFAWEAAAATIDPKSVMILKNFGLVKGAQNAFLKAVQAKFAVAIQFFVDSAAPILPETYVSAIEAAASTNFNIAVDIILQRFGNSLKMNYEPLLVKALSAANYQLMRTIVSHGQFSEMSKYEWRSLIEMHDQAGNSNSYF